MAHRIGWSRHAAQDLDSITDYIAADSPTYAGIVLKSIVNQTRILERFPQAGCKVPEFDDESIRELVVYSYRIIYRLQENEALIVAVIHGKRVLQ
ncbi:MAG: type II toxin-antitoxin system RelE/ParE family toxin [Terriglobales bacterium]|jgi:toxin ParE1/3/4